MAAQSLHCPNCGAAAAAEATRCAHCNSRLATVACPACFGMIFRGAKFCSHCGAEVDRTEAADGQVRLCPRCRVKTRLTAIGPTQVRECPQCDGLWVDTETLQRLCADRERQAAVLGVAVPITPPLNAPLETIRYVPCPACAQLMHRVNFARCSHVIVDVCKPHGTWFDKDELRRVIEFIQSGGLEKARAVELAELQRAKREVEAARSTRQEYPMSAPAAYDARGWAIAAVAEAIAGIIAD